MLTCRRFTFVLALGSFLLATLVWLGAPSQSAQAEEEAGSLTIHKVCLNGSGGAGFTVSVDSTVLQVLDCDGVMVVEDLAPGTHTIEEVISAVDGSFLTAILCGSDATLGTERDIEVAAGEDVQCVLFNLFMPVLPVDGPNVNITNGSTPSDGGTTVTINNSSINNVSDDGLDNANIEENDNINDNAQRQTVTRSQTNSSSND